MSFDQHMQDARNRIVQFNKDHDKNQFNQATTAVSKALDEFTKANVAFQKGDTMGGSAAVLRGVGSVVGAVTSVLSVALGPAGAAFAGIIGAIMGIISSILEAFKPPEESLTDKIQKLIMEETLRERLAGIQSDIDGWKTVEPHIKEWLTSGRILTWEEMTQKIPSWESHYKSLCECFNILSSHASAHSAEWLPVFDITITYATRFWISMEGIAILVSRKRMLEDKLLQPVLPNLPATKTFYDTRHEVAETILNYIKKVHYSSVNEVDFYSVWYNSSKYPYAPYAANHPHGNQGYQANPVYHRIGVIEGSTNENLGIGESNCFAISTSGTIFTIGTRPYTLYVGRAGGEFEQVSWDLFGSNAEQVSIGEIGDNKIVVVVVHKNGSQISWRLFDDSAGTVHETNRNGWTAGAWRWSGSWRQSDVSYPYRVLSVGVLNKPPYWGLYGLVINEINSCYVAEIGLSGGNAKPVIIENTGINKDWMDKLTSGVTPLYYRSEVGPFTISIVGNTLDADIYSQTGTYIVQRVNGVWSGWDARDILGNKDLEIYQGRFYEDGSQVFATNGGMIIRYQDPEDGYKWKIYKNESMQTIWFSKAVSSQAVTALELMMELELALEQKLEDFL